MAVWILSGTVEAVMMSVRQVSIWNLPTAMPDLDMNEMEAAGVDTAHNNVIVYAGGASKWQDRGLSGDDCTTLLLKEAAICPSGYLSGGKYGESPDIEQFCKLLL